LSGSETTLKGTAHDPDGDAELATYEWNFGDASPVASGALTDPYVIEAKHTYVGTPGDMFVARLTVTDINGESDLDDYLIVVGDASDPAELLRIRVNMAIDEGLWRLHKDQTRGTSGDGADYGYWDYGGNTASATGASTEAFEVQGHLPSGNISEDPYVETVQRGLNYLLMQTHKHDISVQTAGDPDTNGNGIGLGCYTDSGRTMYECGITLMTFASSRDPARIAETGDAAWVKDRTYGDIVQDMVDYLAFGQTDSGSGRGGWRYHANYGDSDNSCSQWPVIGMEAVETTEFGVGVTVPQFVKDELDLWIDYIQCDSSGGSGYTWPCDWVNIAKTGGLLCEMKFVGDDKTVPRVIDAADYIDTNWDTDSEHFPSSYYAFYSVMKGFRLLDIEYISPLDDPSGLDWYGDLSRGYANHLVNLQQADGSWPGGYWSSHPLCSAWALLTLLPHPIILLPVADAGPDVANHPPEIDVQFDASGSYHRDPAKNIVQYCWDFDASDGIDWGNPDYCGADPSAAHAFPAVYNLDGTINWPATTKDYTATLRVTDDSATPQHDTDECVVHITGPPWPPVADAGGPYPAYMCETITLDGSGSYDPDGEFYPDPTHPWHGFLVSWEWDLDNDGQYDDATGETVEWSNCVKGLYIIGLKVTDNMADTDTEDTVINVANRPPVADADGPYYCTAGEITFDASASFDPDPGETATLQYRWDFESDGIYDTPWSTDPTVTYTYPACEEYTATLEVKDIDGATDTDTCQVVPSVPMKSFVIDSAEIVWVLCYRFPCENTFAISGNFELPEGYEREDLDKVAVVSIQIAGKEVKDQVALMGLNGVWRYIESPFAIRDDSLGEGIDIKKLDINWCVPKNSFCTKNTFYIEGELLWDEIGLDTEPREATITLQIPPAPNTALAIVIGEETIGFEKNANTWHYGSVPDDGQGADQNVTDGWNSLFDSWLDELPSFQDPVAPVSPSTPDPSHQDPPTWTVPSFDDLLGDSPMWGDSWLDELLWPSW